MIDLTKFNEIFGKNVTKDEIKSIKKKSKAQHSWDSNFLKHILRINEWIFLNENSVLAIFHSI